MQQNHHRRAIAGSSRALAEHAGAVEAGIIVALTGNARKDLSTLLRELQPTVGQSSLAAACVSLCSDGWLFRHPNTGAYALTSRGLDMIKAASQKRGHQARRRAA